MEPSAAPRAGTGSAVAAVVEPGSAAPWASPSLWILVLANLVPVYGVVALGWDVFALVLLFWLENVVIGVL